MQIITVIVLGADAGVIRVSLYHALAGGPCLIGILILIYEIIMTMHPCSTGKPQPFSTPYGGKQYVIKCDSIDERRP